MNEITATAARIYEDRQQARFPADAVQLCEDVFSKEWGEAFSSVLVAAADALNISQAEFNAISDALMEHSEPA